MEKGGNISQPNFNSQHVNSQIDMFSIPAYLRSNCKPERPP